jgi:hypothetical protein
VGALCVAGNGRPYLVYPLQPTNSNEFMLYREQAALDAQELQMLEYKEGLAADRAKRLGVADAGVKKVRESTAVSTGSKLLS